MDINTWLLHYQIPLRFAFFVLFFGMLAGWEKHHPWRRLLTSRRLRWTRHLSMNLLSKIILKMLFPFLLVGLAIPIQEKHLGLLNQNPLIPYALKIILGIVAMDFVLYIQHRALHNLTWLWRFHRVHHIEKQLDVSTGTRFHPGEEIITMGFKIIAVGFFGVPPLAVIIYEICYNFATLYTHVNISLSDKAEAYLRKVIVTPGMHRIHHSDISQELNSNFSFCFSWWDRIFQTYTEAPEAGERKLVFGLERYQDPKFQTLENMLLLPFNVKSLKIRPEKVRATKKKSFEPEVVAVPKKKTAPQL
jgi:sterol desaturase/sphingolipid hydroxylase (fatty acid hydroxylase superfamily)